MNAPRLPQEAVAPGPLRGLGAAAMLLLTSLPALADDDVIEVGEQLVIHFEFDGVPDTGNPSRPVNGISVSLGGMARSSENRFAAQLYDGFDPLAPATDQGSFVRWIVAGDEHPNPHVDFHEFAPIADGSIEGRVVFVNHGPGAVEIPAQAAVVRAAHFADFGAFFPGGDATVTRREIVSPAPSTDFRIIGVTGTEATLQWTAQAGTVYAFQRRTKTDPRWYTFAVRSGLAAGVQTQVATRQAGGVELYRMEIVP